MGYRSEVRACVYGEPELYCTFIASQKLLDCPVFEAFKSELTEHKIGETYMLMDLSCSGVKWYDSYPDVMAWTKFMNDAVEAGLNYEFVRVGEESDDIEQTTNGDNVEWHLFTVTTIESNY